MSWAADLRLRLADCPRAMQSGNSCAIRQLLLQLLRHRQDTSRTQSARCDRRCRMTVRRATLTALLAVPAAGFTSMPTFAQASRTGSHAPAPLKGSAAVMPPNVRALLQWIARSDDNRKSNFIVIDKRQAHMWLFDAKRDPHHLGLRQRACGVLRTARAACAIGIRRVVRLRAVGARASRWVGGAAVGHCTAVNLDAHSGRAAGVRRHRAAARARRGRARGLGQHHAACECHACGGGRCQSIEPAHVDTRDEC